MFLCTFSVQKFEESAYTDLHRWEEQKSLENLECRIPGSAHKVVSKRLVVGDVPLGSMPGKVSLNACLHGEMTQNIYQGIALLQ